MQLLTTGNPKIAKGEKLGYLTNILHLAPSKLSGYNVCPMATAGCASACLNTAGRGGLFTGMSHMGMTGGELVNSIRTGAFTNVIQNARIARTKYFFENRTAFMVQLVKEITNAVKLAAVHELTPVFRLNGTSDLRWENEAVMVKDVTYPNLMSAFPTIQFYDYTKIANRRDLPKNYHLTFSLAETNDANAIVALDNGMNVAAVFHTVPQTYRIGNVSTVLNVVNGDESDLRFLDPVGVIVGLKAKGKAKKDTSGFVK